MSIVIFKKEKNLDRRLISLSFGLSHFKAMANISFPTFTGKVGEEAVDFLDNLEIACVISGRDDNVSLLRIFPLLMKVEAKS